MELLSSTVSLALLLLKPLRPWLAALAALVAALSVAEALMTASLSWLPVVLRLACARPDAWLEMPPRAEEAGPLLGTPSVRRRKGCPLEVCTRISSRLDLVLIRLLA